jgi:hypothetical protein
LIGPGQLLKEYFKLAWYHFHRLLLLCLSSADKEELKLLFCAVQG